MNFKLLIFLVLTSCTKSATGSAPMADNVGTENYALGEQWYQKNNDSAYYYFNKAFASFSAEKDSVNQAKCMIYNAIIQLEEGDNFGSEETSVATLKLLKEPRDNDYLLSVYNSIAVARNNLKDYNTALTWYKKALNASKEPAEIFTIQNNIAVAYTKNKEYQKAIAIFENLLKDKTVNTNLKTKSKILDNLAHAKFLQDENYNAAQELYAALQIREKVNDYWGQNASHAHLADFFLKKNQEKALFHAKRMHEIAVKLQSPDDRLEALQKLIQLDPENYRKYFTGFQTLNDSLQTARNKAKNQFAIIRYDSEKNKTDFLKAQAENSEQKYHILKQYVALALLLAALISAYFWYIRRKKRVLQQNLFEIKKTELKYSKKVHDVVANGVYQVMAEVENQETLDKNTLLDKLEVIYEKSRDISYDGSLKTDEENYSEKIAHLLQSFSSSQTQIIIIGNDEHIWENLSQYAKSEITVVLQELLVNMKKHSSAHTVSLRFEKNEDFISIFYFDDGVGLPKTHFKLNNGLQNTVNRISSCNGIITFDTETEKGTKINIQLPLDKK
ncbi:MAG: tetratricopeptide repeat-containing sensor histidine kinase [Bacteroidia bacterium]